jgi:hypothetical protein
MTRKCPSTNSKPRKGSKRKEVQEQANTHLQVGTHSKGRTDALGHNEEMGDNLLNDTGDDVNLLSDRFSVEPVEGKKREERDARRGHCDEDSVNSAEELFSQFGTMWVDGQQDIMKAEQTDGGRTGCRPS